MPFQSQAQARFMFAKHPKIAKRWASHTPSMEKLPKKKKPSKKNYSYEAIKMVKGG